LGRLSGRVTGPIPGGAGSRFDMWLTILFLAMISILSDWIERQVVLVGEESLMPDFKVWLLADSVSYSRGTDRYFLLKLPSYYFGMDVYRFSTCWYQRVIVWRIGHSLRVEGTPCGS